VDPSIRPYVIFLMAPVFILMGIYMIKAGPLPGQSKSLHWQLGATAIVVGLVILWVGIAAPVPVG
jgi:hypothetical protein